MFTPITINRSGDPIGQKENGAINVAMPSLKIHIVQVRSLLDCYAEILPTGLFSRKKEILGVQRKSEFLRVLLVKRKVITDFRKYFCKMYFLALMSEKTRDFALVVSTSSYIRYFLTMLPGNYYEW